MSLRWIVVALIWVSLHATVDAADKPKPSEPSEAKSSSQLKPVPKQKSYQEPTPANEKPAPAKQRTLSRKAALEAKLLEPAGIEFEEGQTATVREVFEQLQEKHQLSIRFDSPTLKGLTDSDSFNRLPHAGRTQNNRMAPTPLLYDRVAARFPVLNAIRTRFTQWARHPGEISSKGIPHHRNEHFRTPRAIVARKPNLPEESKTTKVLPVRIKRSSPDVSKDLLQQLEQFDEFKRNFDGKRVVENLMLGDTSFASRKVHREDAYSDLRRKAVTGPLPLAITITAEKESDNSNSRSDSANDSPPKESRESTEEEGTKSGKDGNDAKQSETTGKDQDDPCDESSPAIKQSAQDVIGSILDLEVNFHNLDLKRVSIATVLRHTLDVVSADIPNLDETMNGPIQMTQAFLLDYLVEDDGLLIVTRLKALKTKETRVYSLKGLPDVTPEQLSKVIRQSVRPWSWRSQINDLGDQLKGVTIPSEVVKTAFKTGVQLVSDDSISVDMSEADKDESKSKNAAEETRQMQMVGRALADGLVVFTHAMLLGMEMVHYADPPTGTIQTLGKKLVITQSQAAHREIAELMEQLAEE